MTCEARIGVLRLFSPAGKQGLAYPLGFACDMHVTLPPSYLALAQMRRATVHSIDFELTAEQIHLYLWYRTFIQRALRAELQP